MQKALVVGAAAARPLPPKPIAGSSSRCVVLLLPLSSSILTVYNPTNRLHQCMAYFLLSACKLGGVMVSASDLRSRGHGFDSRPFRYSSNNSCQVVHTHVPLSPSSIIWYRSKRREGNGSMCERCSLPLDMPHA